MNVHADLSFLTLILNASVIVQAIIALLALLSMWSWWQIFLKMFQLRRILRETDAFEDEFWQGGNLETLYRSAGQAQVLNAAIGGLTDDWLKRWESLSAREQRFNARVASRLVLPSSRRRSK